MLLGTLSGMLLATLVFVVFMERSLRKVHIQYPRRQVGMKVYDGGSSHLPIKVNPAGVIPAIFASSLLLLPTTLSTFSGNSTGTVMAWILAIGLIVVAQLATKQMNLVPRGLQNFVEWIVESLIGFFAGIMVADLAKRTFWFIVTVFILILFANWAGLIPGVGTVGFNLHGEGVAEGDSFRPFFRGANADLNMTLAMAAVFFVIWFY